MFLQNGGIQVFPFPLFFQIQTLSAVEQDVPAWLEEEGRKSYPSGGKLPLLFRNKQ